MSKAYTAIFPYSRQNSTCLFDSFAALVSQTAFYHFQPQRSTLGEGRSEAQVLPRFAGLTVSVAWWPVVQDIAHNPQLLISLATIDLSIICVGNINSSESHIRSQNFRSRVPEQVVVVSNACDAAMAQDGFWTEALLPCCLHKAPRLPVRHQAHPCLFEPPRSLEEGKGMPKFGRPRNAYSAAGSKVPISSGRPGTDDHRYRKWRQGQV